MVTAKLTYCRGLRTRCARAARALSRNAPNAARGSKGVATLTKAYSRPVPQCTTFFLVAGPDRHQSAGVLHDTRGGAGAPGPPVPQRGLLVLPLLLLPLCGRHPGESGDRRPPSPRGLHLHPEWPAHSGQVAPLPRLQLRLGPQTERYWACRGLRGGQEGRGRRGPTSTWRRNVQMGGIRCAVNLVWEMWRFNLAAKFLTPNPGASCFVLPSPCALHSPCLVPCSLLPPNLPPPNLPPPN